MNQKDAIEKIRIRMIRGRTFQDQIYQAMKSLNNQRLEKIRHTPHSSFIHDKTRYIYKTNNDGSIKTNPGDPTDPGHSK